MGKWVGRLFKSRIPNHMGHMTGFMGQLITAYVYMHMYM